MNRLARAGNEAGSCWLYGARYPMQPAWPVPCRDVMHAVRMHACEKHCSFFQVTNNR